MLKKIDNFNIKSNRSYIMNSNNYKKYNNKKKYSGSNKYTKPKACKRSNDPWPFTKGRINEIVPYFNGILNEGNKTIFYKLKLFWDRICINQKGEQYVSRNDSNPRVFQKKTQMCKNMLNNVYCNDHGCSRNEHNCNFVHDENNQVLFPEDVLFFALVNNSKKVINDVIEEIIERLKSLDNIEIIERLCSLDSHISRKRLAEMRRRTFLKSNWNPDIKFAKVEWLKIDELSVADFVTRYYINDGIKIFDNIEEWMYNFSKACVRRSRICTSSRRLAASLLSGEVVNPRDVCTGGCRCSAGIHVPDYFLKINIENSNEQLSYDLVSKIKDEIIANPHFIEEAYIFISDEDNSEDIKNNFKGRFNDNIRRIIDKKNEIIRDNFNGNSRSFKNEINDNLFKVYYDQRKEFEGCLIPNRVKLDLSNEDLKNEISFEDLASVLKNDEIFPRISIRVYGREVKPNPRLTWRIGGTISNMYREKFVEGRDNIDVDEFCRCIKSFPTQFLQDTLLMKQRFIYFKKLRSEYESVEDNPEFFEERFEKESDHSYVSCVNYLIIGENNINNSNFDDDEEKTGDSNVINIIPHFGKVYMESFKRKKQYDEIKNLNSTRRTKDLERVNPKNHDEYNSILKQYEGNEGWKSGFIPKINIDNLLQWFTQKDCLIDISLYSILGFGKYYIINFMPDSYQAISQKKISDSYDLIKNALKTSNENKKYMEILNRAYQILVDENMKKKYHSMLEIRSRSKSMDNSTVSDFDKYLWDGYDDLCPHLKFMRGEFDNDMTDNIFQIKKDDIFQLVKISKECVPNEDRRKRRNKHRGSGNHPVLGIKSIKRFNESDKNFVFLKNYLKKEKKKKCNSLYDIHNKLFDVCLAAKNIQSLFEERERIQKSGRKISRQDYEISQIEFSRNLEDLWRLKQNLEEELKKEKDITYTDQVIRDAIRESPMMSEDYNKKILSKSLELENKELLNLKNDDDDENYKSDEDSNEDDDTTLLESKINIEIENDYTGYDDDEIEGPEYALKDGRPASRQSEVFSPSEIFNSSFNGFSVEDQLDSELDNVETSIIFIRETKASLIHLRCGPFNIGEIQNIKLSIRSIIGTTKPCISEYVDKKTNKTYLWMESKMKKKGFTERSLEEKCGKILKSLFENFSVFRLRDINFEGLFMEQSYAKNMERLKFEFEEKYTKEEDEHFDDSGLDNFF